MHFQLGSEGACAGGLHPLATLVSKHLSYCSTLFMLDVNLSGSVATGSIWTAWRKKMG